MCVVFGVILWGGTEKLGHGFATRDAAAIKALQTLISVPIYNQTMIYLAKKFGLVAVSTHAPNSDVLNVRTLTYSC